MKKLRLEMLSGLMLLVLSIGVPVQSDAQNASETLYKSKCVACHAADGSGSAIGKKLGAHDFRSAEVQKESEAELTDAIANGKNKMPAYGKSLKADDIKSLVAYIRTLSAAK